jgi:hypothetical protein
MRQLSAHNTPPRPLSTAGTWGKVQIVPASDRVVLDIFARNYDTTGYLHRDAALLNLSIETAIQLRDLLDEAISAALDRSASRQPGLWNEQALIDRGRRAA